MLGLAFVLGIRLQPLRRVLVRCVLRWVGLLRLLGVLEACAPFFRFGRLAPFQLGLRLRFLL